MKFFPRVMAFYSGSMALLCASQVMGAIDAHKIDPSITHFIEAYGFCMFGALCFGLATIKEN